MNCSLMLFAKPVDVNTAVEYLNLSFLVTKPRDATCLATPFGEIARYSKPSPSLMPNDDGILRDIARAIYIYIYIYIIVTDL